MSATVSPNRDSCPTLPGSERHSLIVFEHDGDHREEAVPINFAELYNLKGRLLTLVDATFSDPEQRAAHKTLVWHVLSDWMRDTVMCGHDSPASKANEVSGANAG